MVSAFKTSSEAFCISTAAFSVHDSTTVNNFSGTVTCTLVNLVWYGKQAAVEKTSDGDARPHQVL